MKNLLALAILISISSNIFADHHKEGDKSKRENPNHLMSFKSCMETKAGIGWFLYAADDVFDDIKVNGEEKDKSWNDKKWIEAMALVDLASNYSTVYDVWCKDIINHRMKMEENIMNHKKQKTKE
tara:strand:- start:132 stop:506 length:375 start_codon:yes stop_codon:yes gene_type:complete